MLTEARLQAIDGVANAAAMLLAFALAGCALWFVENGWVTLISLAAGFSLLVSRLQRDRAEIEAKLGLHDQLELARALLSRGAHGQARAIAGRVAEEARNPRTQRAAVEALAWAELGLGRPQSARNALSWVPLDAVDQYCCAVVEDACGNSFWALHIIESAGRKSRLSREAKRFWIDLCARLRGLEAACQLTLRELGGLDPDDARRVLDCALAAGLTAPAQALEKALAELQPA
jgi:hypothetical protein